MTKDIKQTQLKTDAYQILLLQFKAKVVSDYKDKLNSYGGDKAQELINKDFLKKAGKVLGCDIMLDKSKDLHRGYIEIISSKDLEETFYDCTRDNFNELYKLINND